MCVPGWLADWLALPLSGYPGGASTGLEGMQMDTSVYLEIFPDVEVAASPGQGCFIQDRELEKG